jgi:MFS family permease
MTALAASPDVLFVRTRVTWLGYAFMGYFALALSFLGPTMPFIATRLEMTFTEISYFFTIGAVGGLVASLIGDRIVRRVGSSRQLWSAALLTGLALFGITSGTTLTALLFCSFLYGFGIGLVAMVAIAALSAAHPIQASKAIAEGNISGGIAMIIGPILVGLVAQSTLGWQAVAFLFLLLLALLALIFRGTTLASLQQESSSPSQEAAANAPLPLMFWVFGLLILMSVAIEWLVSAWGASFLTSVVGHVPSTAAALMSVFAVAIVIGRLIGRRLLDYMSESRLLVLSLVWVLLAFPIYWLSAVPVLNVLGLFLIGLGVGNLAPLSISAAMIAAGAATGRASARVTLFPNLANLTIIPLVGVLADGVGIQQAYVVMIVVMVVAIILASNTHRIRRAAA